jgi:hypothetical protein
MDKSCSRPASRGGAGTTVFEGQEDISTFLYIVPLQPSPLHVHPLSPLFCESSPDMNEPAVLERREGSHQGCPLGGIVFGLAYARALRACTAEFPSVSVVSYWDDTCLVGPVQDVTAVVEFLRVPLLSLIVCVLATRGMLPTAKFRRRADLACMHPCSSCHSDLQQ